MPQYLSPGVYVEEVSSGIQPIAGVGTSTAGFIGQVVADEFMMPVRPGLMDDGDPKTYTLAPEGEPQLITSWGAFKQAFGDFQVGNQTLAHAVYGFFHNGGSRCWVVRVANLAAQSLAASLAELGGIDEVALVAVPGATDKALQEAVIDHCENSGDRFAILDGKADDNGGNGDDEGGGEEGGADGGNGDDEGGGEEGGADGGNGDDEGGGEEGGADSTQGKFTNARNSNCAALYYPWIQVYDPVTEDLKSVAPSGHLAGIYSRVDTERGVHKAPANIAIRGALGVDRRLSKADQDGLNPGGINVIRAFGNDITVWGARTLGGEANGEWKYINVRRLFLFLRESIDEGTRWVVFEPNTPGLWAKITRNINAFLTNVWRSGALFGATPEEAFYVKCDADTNPPEVRDLGQVVTEIGVAPVKPAEFVVFRISQWAGVAG